MSRIENQLKPLMIALCVLMLALGDSSRSAAQSYPSAWSADDDRARTEILPGSNLRSVESAPDLPSSTLQLPNVAAPGFDDTGSPTTAHALQSTIEALPCANCDRDPDNLADEPEIPGDIARYQALHSDFDDDAVGTSWIGLSFARDRRKLKSGEYARGLLIVTVAANSPAAKAGLRPLRGKARAFAEVATLAAALVFPPAMLAYAAIDNNGIGQSYDMIIGVDGERVDNVEKFEDRIRSMSPGAIAYLNVVRNGSRIQVPVSIPAGWDNNYICDWASCIMPP